MDDPHAVLEHLPRTIPWAPLVFFTAFITSLQCDTHNQPGIRWQEGLLQSAVTAVTAWTAYQISSVNESPSIRCERAHGRQPASGRVDDEFGAVVQSASTFWDAGCRWRVQWFFKSP
jgi:hypothetical protein